jgi:pimeloyl-ACP methyl ester carboxylesterase
MSPGVKMRVGPGRLYVPLTELLTSLGHSVLRFDYSGLGDSEGDLTEAVLADVYAHIEGGRYLDDSLAALWWLRRERGHERLIVGGLCGGAITALYAAQHDSSVEALLAIGMTVTVSSDAVLPAAYLTNAELAHRRRGYLRRLLSPRSWWRLLTFQSELGVIRRSFLSGLAGLGRKGRTPNPESPGAAPPEFLANFNRRFPEAFFSFLGRGGRALMLFSGHDRVHSEYQEKFVALHADRLGEHSERITEHVIPGANHILSMSEWRQEMLAVTQEWIAMLPDGG